MKYSLLDLVQTILSSMDGDEVNSISDTVESMQVATIVRTVYFDIRGRANLPEDYGIVQLTPSGDNSQPVLMTIPSTVAKLLWIKYDAQTVDDTVPQWQTISFKPVTDFFDYMTQFDTSDTNVGTFTLSSGDIIADVNYYNNTAPSWYTIVGDNTILFDSYDAGVDVTLQASKTMVYAQKTVPFTMSDTFIPEIDEAQHPLLLAEAKALAWAEMKQTQHAKAEQSARNNWVHLQHSKHVKDGPTIFDTAPNYGRRRR